MRWNKMKHDNGKMNYPKNYERVLCEEKGGIMYSAAFSRDDPPVFIVEHNEEFVSPEEILRWARIDRREQ